MAACSKRSAGFQPAMWPIVTHAGWRSRGYLPHFDHGGATQHIVFGLASAPTFDVTWIEQGEPATDNGPPLLKGVCADIIQDALLHFDGERYRLVAWCVMPTHVHVVAEQMLGYRLDRVVHSWKSFTANGVNAAAGRTGRLWQREYFDRFMRDEEHLQTTIRYVERNPVAAKFVAS